MSGKAGPSSHEGGHGHWLIEGPTTIVSWLTVFPVRGATVFDTTTGRRAMHSIPLVGVILGLIAGAVSLLASVSTPLLGATCAVITLEVLSRGMHLDGVADVGDALGSYAEPDGARRILADRYTGALGVAAVVLTVMVQIGAVSALLAGADSSWRGAATVALCVTISRWAGMVVCRRGRTAFSPTGFGALVVGSVSPWVLAAWAVTMSVAAWPVSGWTGAVAITVVYGTTEVTTHHCTRRFEGLNGDCVGASIELAMGVAALVCVLC